MPTKTQGNHNLLMLALRLQVIYDGDVDAWISQNTILGEGLTDT